jgi:hypothetical protein
MWLESSQSWILYKRGEGGEAPHDPSAVMRVLPSELVFGHVPERQCGRADMVLKLCFLGIGLFCV